MTQPYDGSFVGSQVGQVQRRFAEVRQPLRPTEERRRMDFPVVASARMYRFDLLGLVRFFQQAGAA